MFFRLYGDVFRQLPRAVPSPSGHQIKDVA
jgi:hypothetical protein